MKETLTPVKESKVSLRNLSFDYNDIALGYPTILFLEIDQNGYSYCFKDRKNIVLTGRKMVEAKHFPEILAPVIHSIEAILIQHKNGSVQKLAELHKYLIQIKEIERIPLILTETTNLKESIRKRAYSPYVDDIILNEININDLTHKILLLKKIKRENGLCLNGEQQKLLKERMAEAEKGKQVQNFFKRLFDLVVSLSLLIILLPVLIIITMLVKLTSKGPVFYISQRSGRNYKIFNFIKFRTMYVDADKKLAEMQQQNQYGSGDGDGNVSPVFFKIHNDPRITRVGRFLRNFSLDELPQLFNVLKGDMSLVGNRPLPLYEAKTLTTDNCVERFDAPAGITGLWQVKKRGTKDMSIQERIDLDIEYAKSYSLRKDLSIILSTPKALIQKENV